MVIDNMNIITQEPSLLIDIHPIQQYPWHSGDI